MRLAAILAVLAHCVARTAAVNASHVVVGQTVALTGALASTGYRSGVGLRAAFQEANDAGGVESRNVSLVALDDRGLGPLALQNVADLTATHDALLVAAPYGSAAFAAMVPTLASLRTPLVGPLTGFASTRSPFRDVVVNVRPSFADEAVALARFLVEYLRVQRIAAFYTDDDLGLGGYATLVAALDSVGVRLVASAMYAKNTTAPDISAPLQAILGAAQRPQAVVLLCLEADIAEFILAFRQDPRADVNCSFLSMSVSSASALSGLLGANNWRNVYSSRTVPMPGADYAISRRFTQVAAKYIPADLLTDQLTFESYVIGRFIVEVLKGISSRNLTPVAFLDAVYNTRLYYLDDIPVGLYGRNFSGCEHSICACNSGMRRVYMGTLDPLSGKAVSNPSFPTAQYPLTQCSTASSLIRRPILFGQLLPTDDPLVSIIAQDINAGLKVAFAELNAAGGLNGRQYVLVSAEYSGDPANATAALVDRWPLVALLGSVVANGVTLPATIPRIATFDLTARPTEPAFELNDVRTQCTIPFEMLALASYVVGQLGAQVHLRVRRSATGAAMLATLTKSVNTFQGVPASALQFDSATVAFEGLSAGHVIGIGSTADMLAWLGLLQDRPALTLLTIKPCALPLLAAGAINASASVQDRVLFPFVTQAASDATADRKPYTWQYGHLMGTLVAKVLGQSHRTLAATSTSPSDMIKAWYDVQVIRLESAVMGPYYAANCSSTGGQQCECNLGAHSAAIVSANPLSNVLHRYESSTCNVQYTPLKQQDSPASDSVTLAAALGAGLGAAALLVALGLGLLARRRNNRAAPKDATRPFCIVFTDIQASTALWATVPNDMAPALDAHHCLIRKLIRKYNLYEVKTIGDSFMCAARSPAPALRFALAVQAAFHGHAWGTAAFDAAYAALSTEEAGLPGGEEGPLPECWNGLRVRVGIHYGCGDIKLDPVSHGYDYYGTVVNTAARIESVCHGGQVCVSEAVYRLVHGHVPGTVWTDLGSHVLRGLKEPLHLYQVLPEGALAERRFPPLRLNRVDNREATLEEADELGGSHRSTSTTKHPNHSVVPSSDSALTYGVNGK
eukprot:EG_transcript_635